MSQVYFVLYCISRRRDKQTRTQSRRCAHRQTHAHTVPTTGQHRGHTQTRGGIRLGSLQRRRRNPAPICRAASTVQRDVTPPRCQHGGPRSTRSTKPLNTPIPRHSFARSKCLARSCLPVTHMKRLAVLERPPRPVDVILRHGGPMPANCACMAFWPRRNPSAEPRMYCLYIVPRTGVADTCQTHYGQTGPTLHA